MKKLLIAAAIVCAAVVSQAAVSVTWQSGTGVKDVNGNAFAAGTVAGYTCAIAFSQDNDMSTTFAAGGTLSTSDYKTKGSAGFNAVTGETFGGGTYYAQLTITTTDGRKYTSDIASFKIADGALNGPTINFTTGNNIGGSSKIGDPSYSGAPEPTSAMLMLIGVAGLALKRRRA